MLQTVLLPYTNDCQPPVLRPLLCPSALAASAVAGGIMVKYGLTFAAVGLAFSGIDCAAETFRGELL